MAKLSASVIKHGNLEKIRDVSVHNSTYKEVANSPISSITHTIRLKKTKIQENMLLQPLTLYRTVTKAAEGYSMPPSAPAAAETAVQAV